MVILVGLCYLLRDHLLHTNRSPARGERWFVPLSMRSPSLARCMKVQLCPTMMHVSVIPCPHEMYFAVFSAHCYFFLLAVPPSAECAWRSRGPCRACLSGGNLPFLIHIFRLARCSSDPVLKALGLAYSASFWRTPTTYPRPMSSGSPFPPIAQSSWLNVSNSTPNVWPCR